MGGLLGGKAAPTSAPRMADAEDPAVVAARKRAAVEAQSRSGRTSTVMTNRATQSGKAPAGQAGTTAYKASLLGNAS